jgi:O-antigen/teichoic acid export membrane protein
VAIVSFYLSPFIVRHLGATAYGVWSLLVALVGYLGLLDFGVRGAVTQFVARHHAVGDTKASSAIGSAAIVLFGCAGLVAIAIAVIVAMYAHVLFNIPPELIDISKRVLVISGFTVASTLMGAVFGGIVTGLQRFDVSAGIEILITTVRTIGVIVALEDGHGLPALAYVHLATSLAYGLLAWLAVRRLYPDFRLNFRQPMLAPIRTILSFSAFLSVIHVLGMLIFYTDAVVIAVVLPISAVAVFAIAGNLCEYASKVAGALSKVTGASEHERSKAQEQRDADRRVLHGTAFLRVRSCTLRSANTAKAMTSGDCLGAGRTIAQLWLELGAGSTFSVSSVGTAPAATNASRMRLA